MHSHLPIKRVQRSLRWSTYEGMAYGAVQGAGEHFTSAYGVALGASNYQLALLSAIPSFLGSLAQSTSAGLANLLGSRKRVTVLAAAISGSMWLPLLGLSLFALPHRPLWLIVFVTVYAVWNAVTGPAWASIMAEMVPDRMRGRYFGNRSRWGSVANTSAFLLAGGLLFLFRNEGLQGFALVFGMAFLFRMLSVGLLTTLLEVPHGPRDETGLGLGAFLRELPSTNLGHLILYLFSVNFAVNLAGPFFSPYMLRDLGFDYLTFTILEVFTILAGILTVTHWGAAADRAGNRKILVISGFLISFVPLLWLLSTSRVYLGFAQFYSGVSWAGFNLVSANFVYDATSSHNRTAYLAYFGTGAGIAAFLGALTGGLLINHMPNLKGSPILTMFLLSGSLRLLVTVGFLPHIREVRPVRLTRAAELFHIMLGGKTVHRPAAEGRLHSHHHLHGHKEPEHAAEKQ